MGARERFDGRNTACAFGGIACGYQLSDVPTDIDLLIVDGPPWAIHPYVRGAAASLFARIRPGGRVLLDDAARPGEQPPPPGRG